ncbi:MAG TPA: LytR C-terminal domain-containing protein [Propionibacteriaceae bacterium]|nr:LytR C-terminal domain-containing protein [Propionibacteriaceae bacterium]
MIGRVFRLVRTPLTLLVLLGVLAYGAWWGYTNVLKETPPPPPAKCVPQQVKAGELRADQVTVSVFNGGTKKGLAGDVGRSLRQRGFKVQRTDNTDEKIQRTVIVGAGAKNPEVLLVKGFFKKAVVKADKRPDHSVDVLVGNDYAGFNKKGKATIKVKAKAVCLPAPVNTEAPAVTG